MKEDQNVDRVEVEAETGQAIHVNLEGIKLEGVSKEDATRIAEAAAKQAFAAVEANYLDTITQLEGDKTTLVSRLEAITQERDVLRAEKMERERHEAFENLFNDFAVPREARIELYGVAFAGMSVEQARPVLKYMGKPTKPSATEAAEKDVPLLKEQTELLDDPIALGRAIAEQLMPTAQN